MESNFIFEQLVTPQLFIQLSKMQKFQNYVEGRAWNVDINKALLSVEGIGNFDLRLVGSASSDTSDFLWAWANESEGVDRASVAFEAVDRLHEYGERQEIGLLTTPVVKFQPGSSPAALFAMLTSYGYGESFVPYAAPFNDGKSLFFIAVDAPEIAEDKSDNARFISGLFPPAIECAQSYNRLTGGQISLSKAYGVYLKWLGKAFDVKGSTVEIADNTGQMKVKFTPEGLVDDIRADLLPLPENA